MQQSFNTTSGAVQTVAYRKTENKLSAVAQRAPIRIPTLQQLKEVLSASQFIDRKDDSPAKEII